MDSVESYFADLVESDPLLEWIDAEVEASGDERLIVRVPESERIMLDPLWEGMGGVVHAGIIATLVDTVGGAARKQIDRPTEASLSTTDMNVSYLRPAVGDVVATGVADRVGSSMAVVSVTIESETPRGDFDEVAVGRATYHVDLPDADD